ncbi:MAG: Rpn family recombination-promoting nuclease/putative transposase [Gammaproteobacteria bacterium]|nr:Rpn family recombination-promoting nuclease/putative transposase [Gammaproteobacteria bacterium]MYE85332.1 Rpn family recombination-promoting nuclease/putative transposase [Gammaproteobacteria bacterium]MYH16547.1 Rpn family recombination-promoting nuclease/putative transposase [Gammaproteobacteria bacterium]MYK81883.1 Rpn family recombination-promoting nuclease/putative transposase [Gammaproteobacteria bacterium]
MAKGKKKGGRRHDAAFKSLYAFSLMAWDLMEAVLPLALFEELDFDTLERLPTEWFGPSLQRRLGDAVWRVRRRGGGSLILLVEFQRKPDRLMPLRAGTYVSLMLEDLAGRDELDPGGRLPLVRPVVLYNGLRPWRGPVSLADLSLDSGADWPGLTLVDMGRAKVEDLPNGNAVTLQIEIEQGALAHDPKGVLGRLSNCLGGPARREVRVAFVDWIQESLGPELLKVPNLKDRLTEIVELGEFQDMKSLMLKSMQDYWQEQGFERSMAQAAEWRLELAQADERARLCRMVRRKFGRRAAERLVVLIRGVTDPERLEEVGDWIIDCGSEAEFLARAERAGDR